MALGSVGVVIARGKEARVDVTGEDAIGRKGGVVIDTAVIYGVKVGQACSRREGSQGEG